MNEMRERQLVALELKTPYSPVIHNSKAIANLQHLDGKLCASELVSELESAIMIQLEMKKNKQGVN